MMTKITFTMTIDFDQKGHVTITDGRNFIRDGDPDGATTSGTVDEDVKPPGNKLPDYTVNH